MAGQFGLRFRLPRKPQVSFTCRKSTTWDRRLYFPTEGRHAVDFVSDTECSTAGAIASATEIDVVFSPTDTTLATGYGLDGPGIESRWGRDFPHLSRPALGPTQPPV
jgi:hypothetical protein